MSGKAKRPVVKTGNEKKWNSAIKSKINRPHSLHYKFLYDCCADLTGPFEAGGQGGREGDCSLPPVFSN